MLKSGVKSFTPLFEGIVYAYLFCAEAARLGVGSSHDRVLSRCIDAAVKKSIEDSLEWFCSEAYIREVIFDCRRRYCVWDILYEYGGMCGYFGGSSVRG